MNKFTKTAWAVCALVSSAPVLFAQATAPDINLDAAESAATSVETALTSFFNDTLVPLVTAIGGLSLAAYLVLAIFKWARKLGK